MEYKKVPSEINDFVGDNVRLLEQLFPSAVKDGLVDFAALKEELGQFEKVGNEKFELSWSGKQDAKKLAQQDVYNRTLKFIPQDSKNADTTENLYIEGNNLEVLKLLRQNYYGAIKMIYIDPPYNTGNDFVYNDKFAMNAVESDIAEGVRDEDGNPMQKNNQSSNRFHANWLNMIYPRLKLAKDLLTEDGVVFISIDDNEVAQLRKVCDEVFGEDNFIAQAIVQKSTNGMGDKKGFAKNHEFILCYQKSSNAEFYGLTPDEEYVSSFNIKDEYGKYKMDGILMKKGAGSRRQDSPTLYFPLFYSTETGRVYLTKEDGLVERYPIKSDGTDGRWTWGKEKIKTENHRLYASPNGTIYIKDYLYSDRRMKIKTILTDKRYLTDRATNEIKDIFQGKPFDTPKPVELIKHIADISCKDDDIVLDFFSGSATTAHAVMQLNAEDGGNRKFIMVQYPEITDEKSEAYKAGYKNICEIGKERIRRAGDKIKQEIEEKNAQLKLGEEPKKVPDIGFKVFRTADTNIKWNYVNSSDQFNTDDLSHTPDLADFFDGFKDVDVVYEVMLRQKDVPLSASLETLDNIGKRTYLYASSYLVCLETEITEEMVDKLAAIEPLPNKFIFRDSAFGDDINLKDETFRRLKNLIDRNNGDVKTAYTVEFI